MEENNNTNDKKIEYTTSGTKRKLGMVGIVTSLFSPLIGVGIAAAPYVMDYIKGLNNHEKKSIPMPIKVAAVAMALAAAIPVAGMTTFLLKVAMVGGLAINTALQSPDLDVKTKNSSVLKNVFKKAKNIVKYALKNIAKENNKDKDINKEQFEVEEQNIEEQTVKEDIKTKKTSKKLSVDEMVKLSGLEGQNYSIHSMEGFTVLVDEQGIETIFPPENARIPMELVDGKKIYHNGKIIDCTNKESDAESLDDKLNKPLDKQEEPHTFEVVIGDRDF